MVDRTKLPCSAQQLQPGLRVSPCAELPRSPPHLQRASWLGQRMMRGCQELKASDRSQLHLCSLKITATATAIPSRAQEKGWRAAPAPAELRDRGAAVSAAILLQSKPCRIAVPATSCLTGICSPLCSVKICFKARLVSLPGNVNYCGAVFCFLWHNNN